MKHSNKFFKLTAAIFSLSALAAHAATIVTPDSANSTIGNLSNRSITETINDSGLTDTDPNIENWYHDQNTAGDGNFYYIGDRNNETTPGDTEFTFTFNSTVAVDTVHFWTYDRVGDSPGREIKDFDISFSTDNGTTFSGTTSLTAWLDRNDARIDVDPTAGTNFKIGHQSRSFSTQTGVTDIKFSNIVTHVEGSRYVAFSEVKFSAIPEPSTALLSGLGLLFLLRRRR